MDKSKILISIIIPTFNVEKTLQKCLESIITQNTNDIEICIVDGGSTDQTLEIIKRYQLDSPYIKWISESDKGIYDAMNKGVDLCSGNWIYFLGSDDSLQNQNVLREVKSVIERNPKSLFLYGDILTSANYIQRYQDYSFEKLVNLNICHQAIFYHYTLFKKSRYNLNYGICADWDMNLKVFRKKNLPIYLNKVIANYNLNGASNNWGSHPDFLNNFKPLTMVLRYRSVFYFASLYTLKQLKYFKSLISNFFGWISR